MKKRLLLCGLILSTTPVLFAQHLEFQSGSEDHDSKTLFERVSKIEKKTNRFNLYLNMQGTFNAYFNDNNVIDETDGVQEINEFAFKMNQLRIEVKGNITDRIFYRYRQRLNRANNPQALDNLPNSIDYAALGFHVSDKLAVFAGKQSTCFGGFEFDLNPVEVYQYCDMLEYMSNFLTGVDFSYWLNKNNELRFQIVDSRNGKFSEFYGPVPAGINPAKAPLGYTLNWNGSFFENMLKTRWSASIFHEATNKNWYYYALGTELNLKKFHMFFDFMYSTDNLDRTGIISEMARNAGYDTRILDTRYLSLVAHFDYRILPKVNVFVKGMYETASVDKTNGVTEKGKYRTSWGYLGGIEYYPMKENLHFFLNYIGRSFDYTDLAKNTFGAGNFNPQRMELGLIYVIPVF